MSELVTRCKDCYFCEGTVGKEYCGKIVCYVTPNFFCADGCREDNGFIPNFDIINSVEWKRMNCGSCKWHDEFSGACCNGDSDFRADFTLTEDKCEHWEELKNAGN